MADRPVISNTTPLISLLGIDQLDLLPQLYGQVWIPEIVLDDEPLALKDGAITIEDAGVTIERAALAMKCTPVAFEDAARTKR